MKSVFFKMAEVNVEYNREKLNLSSAGTQKYARKRVQHVFEERIEKSVPRVTVWQSLVITISDHQDKIVYLQTHYSFLYPSCARFIRSSGITDTVSSRKFLEAAMNTDDCQLFFTVYKFFEQRNIRMRGSPKFQPGILTLSPSHPCYKEICLLGLGPVLYNLLLYIMVNS